MSLKYRELAFKTDELRESSVRHIFEDAEVSLPGTRVVRIGRESVRVSLHLLKGQYFLVHRPRRPELLPRVWLVTVPGFALCEIPIGRDGWVCNKRVVSIEVDDKELIPVCDYHGSGLRVFKFVLDRQLKSVPPSLCVRFCSQCIKTGASRLVKRERIVEGKKVEYHVWVEVYECRAFMAYKDEKEEAKRRRSYRGMYILCLEDWWWRRYLRRHELE